MRTNSKTESFQPSISLGRAIRRHRSKLERRRIVEETLVPGASVAVITRSYGVNANQVFNWRKLYREGRLEVRPSETRFLPARIIDSNETEQRPVNEAVSGYAGAIDIEIGGARVRITGSADPGCIRAALEQLRR
jgi:transposase